MGEYYICSDQYEDPALTAFLHSIILVPDYAGVDITPYKKPMVFETYAEAAAVIAFVATCIDSEVALGLYIRGMKAGEEDRNGI